MAQMTTPDTEWIKAWLERTGWTRKQTADALGLHYNTFCNYVAGCRPNGNASPLPLSIKLAMQALEK